MEVFHVLGMNDNKVRRTSGEMNIKSIVKLWVGARLKLKMWRLRLKQKSISSVIVWFHPKLVGSMFIINLQWQPIYVKKSVDSDSHLQTNWRTVFNNIESWW